MYIYKVVDKVVDIPSGKQQIIDSDRLGKFM